MEKPQAWVANLLDRYAPELHSRQKFLRIKCSGTQDFLARPLATQVVQMDDIL